MKRTFDPRVIVSYFEGCDFHERPLEEGMSVRFFLQPEGEPRDLLDYVEVSFKTSDHDGPHVEIRASHGQLSLRPRASNLVSVHRDSFGAKFKKKK